MKAENKNSLMGWAVVILAVMNLSMVITVLYSKYQTGKIDAGSGTSLKQTELDSEKYSGRYFRDQLNLSDEQMEKFKEINPVFRPKARSITLELAEKRRLMFSEMTTARSDTSKLNALCDSIGHLHSNLKKITYWYYLELKSICSPQQQSKLEQVFGEMFNNDVSLGSGKGNQRGWQGGRRFNN